MKTLMWLVALALMTVALPSIAHAKPVTTEDLLKAQENAGEWLTYGRDYRHWRYSPLAEITPDNAAKLWSMSTGGQFGGLESIPLSGTASSISAPITPACSRSMPSPETSSGSTSRNTNRA